MTSQLNHSAGVSHIEDLRRQAAAGRRARPGSGSRSRARSGPPIGESIAIRSAIDADREALERLAALDSAAPLHGEVLVAVVDGELQAAIVVADGVAIADPFRPSALLVELLGVRAARLRGGPVPRRGLRLRLRRRAAAYRTA